MEEPTSEQPPRSRRAKKVRSEAPMKETNLYGLEAFFTEADLQEFLRSVRAFIGMAEEIEPTASNVSESSQLVPNILLVSLVLIASALSLFFSTFVVLIPLIHGVGGYVLHRNQGWRFFQPGEGGVRFVALNGVAWTFYALTIVLHVTHMALGDFILYLTAFVCGLFSMSFVFASLFAFQPKLKEEAKGSQKTSGRRFSAVQADKQFTEEYEREFESQQFLAPEFSEKLQQSVIMRSGENASGVWWVFISLLLSLAFSSAWVLTIANGRGVSAAPIKALVSVLATAAFLGCVPVTHAVGGKWKNIRTNFSAFQPGIGGVSFVALQGFGWAFYSLTVLLGIFSTLLELQPKLKKNKIISNMMLFTALSGLTSELLIFSSLFFFKPNKHDSLRSIETKNPLYKKLSVYDDSYEQSAVERFLDKILSAVFLFANMLFGPGGDLDLNTRAPKLTSATDHLKADEKWEKAVKHMKATGDQYLVVGCGFVGKRLIHRLLQRGESKIRVFDIIPSDSFKDVPEVEFIKGDVTKLEQISKACEGVDTIYATFALIRFMDRLEHQVKLSYHVNVTGTKVLFEAAKEQNVKRIIVTSSSHATTDERSLPRFDRTETAPYVTRQTAHNHYGWTKALADEFALSQNSEKLKVVVLRPCSGVFGGDDRTSFEKCVDLGVAPGIGSFCTMDWVYVENVVLGHLLAEYGLQIDKEGVAGEAFNISNNDATTWLDFWYLVKKICILSPKHVSSRVKIEFCFVPMSVIWIVAYLSETVQRVFKGKVSLGKDIDTMTPAMLSTAMMSYSYKSEKAKQVLGYEPVFTLDEGIQRSVWEYYKIKYEKKKLF